MEFSRGANGGFRPSEVGGGTKGGRFRPTPALISRSPADRPN